MEQGSAGERTTTATCLYTVEALLLARRSLHGGALHCRTRNITFSGRALQVETSMLLSISYRAIFKSICVQTKGVLSFGCHLPFVK